MEFADANARLMYMKDRGLKQLNELEYLACLATVINDGVYRENRTGVDSIGVFAPAPMVFDLRLGFPLLTTKKMHWPSIVHELIWFLSGSTNIKYLKQNKIRIWDEWADSKGELGPVYGKQWRQWQRPDGTHVDQIKRLENLLMIDPMSRRHVVSAWNPGEVDKMALPPCHMFFQCYVDNDKTLHMQMYQRSADMFLGVPFNIASYALLLTMLATVTEYTPGTLTMVLGDAHVYTNHLAQVQTQLDRNMQPNPTVTLPHKQSVTDYKFEDIVLNDYDPCDALPAPVAV